jgi:ATP-dependent exoDNAse (exonuclease V) beta subunit
MPARSRGSRARRQLDLFGPERPGASAGGAGRAEEDGGTGPIDVLEGVIDLAFREADGWVIADYKTDVGTDPDFAARKVAYRRQVELYAEAWAALTGEPVKERVLFFTSQDRIESW